MSKETLDNFITRVRKKSNGNAWVLEPKFEGLYVRYRLIQRFIQNHAYDDVLDLANVIVEEKHRRTGVFTSLVARIRQTYPGMHLYVENASPEFKPLLQRLGFTEVPYDSFFLNGDNS